MFSGQKSPRCAGTWLKFQGSKYLTHRQEMERLYLRRLGERSAGVPGLSLEAGVTIMWFFTFSLVLFYIV